MPALPSVCARAGKALCQEVWDCLTGESPNWNHLERWHQSHHNSSERYTLLLAAVYAVNTKCWLLHTGCGSKYHSREHCCRCCYWHGAPVDAASCSYCRKCDSVVLWCVTSHLGVNPDRETQDSVLLPFHPVDPANGRCRINGDRSESLIDIDTSEVLFNGRVIQELDIFGIAEYNQIDLTPGVTGYRNPVHKACYFGSRLQLDLREVFGLPEPEHLTLIYKEHGPSCQAGPWLPIGYFPNSDYIVHPYFRLNYPEVEEQPALTWGNQLQDQPASETDGLWQ